jgi:hypothetical protein
LSVLAHGRTGRDASIAIGELTKELSRLQR